MNKDTEVTTKADRRAARKRPRMRVHGASLKRPSKFAGFSIASSSSSRKRKNGKK